MSELTRMARLWLAAQAHRLTNVAIPAAARNRFRRMDLITSRNSRSVELTRLGYALAQRLRKQLRLSDGALPNFACPTAVSSSQ